MIDLGCVVRRPPRIRVSATRVGRSHPRRLRLRTPYWTEIGFDDDGIGVESLRNHPSAYGMVISFPEATPFL
jgi:hypothetical protein